MSTTNYILTVWTFFHPTGKEKDQQPKKVSAIYDMTEDQARASLAAKGHDLTGWTGKKTGTPVKVEEVFEDGPKRYTVRLERTQFLTVEVEAETESDIKKKAAEEAERSSSWDWEDGDYEITEWEPIKSDTEAA
jgi:hypothetical protein